MPRLRTAHLIPALALIAPMYVSAASFCIAVNGGLAKGGESFIAPNFTVPAAMSCAPWSGFTKIANTVIAIATGTACTANNGKVVTFSIFNTDWQYFGPGVSVSDQITLCPTGTTGCSVSGEDTGEFTGPAEEQVCTTKLLTLPVIHD